MTRVDIQPDGALKPLAYIEGMRNAVPGVHWDKDRKAFIGPPHGLEALVEWLRAPRRHVTLRGALPEALPRRARIPHAGLLPHQCNGGDWLIGQLLDVGAGLLADDMGLGKTAVAIRAAEVLASARIYHRAFTLVICPAVVAPHWLREVQRWSWQGTSTAGICETRNAKAAKKLQALGAATSFALDVPHTDFRIITPERFRKHAQHPDLMGAHTVIADEAHYYANARAKRTVALAGYVASQRRRPRLMLLTGTPLSTRPRDLHALLDLMQPDAWGSFFTFTRRYCGGHYEAIPNTELTSWNSEGVSHVEELRARLRHVMLRRSKADVGGLPPKIRSMVPVEMPERARKQLQAAAKDAATGDAGFAALGRMLNMTETHKLKAACELAESVIAQGGRPLIFTWRKDAAQQIGERLCCPVVTGETASAKRAETLAGATAAVCTMASVTTGISLTQFDTVIFAGLYWVPSTLLQAENRPHRIGQMNSVNIYYLIGLGTVDEHIQHRIIERLDLFDATIGSAQDGNGMRVALAGGSEDDAIAELIASVTGR